MRRGFVTAGTWCVDRNLTVDAWPTEDMVAIVRDVELAGGGSGCNFAIDMRRLDPDMPVETQGVIGTGANGDFLIEAATSHGVDVTGLHRSGSDRTQVTDAYLSADTGRRTHILFYGLADALTPDHFDFTATQAKYLHLGLPGIHRKMDTAWGTEANGWLATLKKARAAGLLTNMELVAAPADELRRIVRPCLPQLDMLVVNDYEIGALAERDLLSHGQTDVVALQDAAREVLAMGAMQAVVVHHTQGAFYVDTYGTEIDQPSVAIPDAERKGANGAGDAFAAGFFYGLHEGWTPRDCLRLGHATAAACLRAPGTYTSVENVETCLALANHWGWRG